MSVRVLPLGAKMEDNKDFKLTDKVVEHCDPNKKFSKRKPSVTNNSTAFSTEPMDFTPRTGLRRSTVPVFDTFDGNRPDRVNNLKRTGVKITGASKMQAEKARKKEDNPKFMRRSVDNSHPLKKPSMSYAPEVEPMITANGLKFAGGKGTIKNRRVNDETNLDLHALQNKKDYSAMKRFINTPRGLSTVDNNPTRAETMHDDRSPQPQPKSQRFRASPGYRTSLVGVLSPEPASHRLPAYKLTTPWHIEE